MKESAIFYSRISLRYEIIGDWKAATIRLDGPDARNCIDEGLAEELRDACRRVDEDDDCRLVTVTGSGDCFSAGRTAVDDGDGKPCRAPGQVEGCGRAGRPVDTSTGGFERRRHRARPGTGVGGRPAHCFRPGQPCPLGAGTARHAVGRRHPGVCPGWWGRRGRWTWPSRAGW